MKYYRLSPLLTTFFLFVIGLGYLGSASALIIPYGLEGVNTTVILKYNDGSADVIPVTTNVEQFFSVDSDLCSVPISPTVACSSQSATAVKVNLPSTTISTAAIPTFGNFTRGLDLLAGDAVLTWSASCPPEGCGDAFTFGNTNFRLLSDIVTAQGPQSTLGPCTDVENCMISLGFLNESLLDGTWSGAISKTFIAQTPSLLQQDQAEPVPVELRITAGLGSVTIVPVPAALPLMSSALAVLAIFGFRRSVNKA